MDCYNIFVLSLQEVREVTTDLQAVKDGLLEVKAESQEVKVQIQEVKTGLVEVKADSQAGKELMQQVMFIK